MSSKSSTQINAAAIENQSVKAPFLDIVYYSLGDGAANLTLNAIWSFAMLYYTNALGLDYKYAGIAMAVALLWDAVMDPVMGYISDNTRSRFGRRHLYMLVGGLLLAVTSYFTWVIPHAFTHGKMLFWYIIAMNLFVRMASTVFLVPFGALGFEICTDYHQRTTLQCVRAIAQVVFNLAGPGLSWAIFFKDRNGVESTNVAANFVHMGLTFTIVASVLILATVFLTRKYMIDSRNFPRVEHAGALDCFKSLLDTLIDPYPRGVFLFLAVASFGAVFYAMLQMYVYVSFMQLSSIQRSIVHGLTMVGSGIGAFWAPAVVKWLDKKNTIILSSILSIAANAAAAGMFLTGLVPTKLTWMAGGLEIPIAVILFAACSGLFWMGVGVITPVAYSMMADVSEINKYRQGFLKDGTYSAMLSFVGKATASVAMVVSGFCLGWAGFVAGQETQTHSAVWNIAAITFLSGVALSVSAVVLIRNYPVTKAFMQKAKEEYGKKQGV